MSHLGERVSSLVDGQLPPAAAENALAHVAVCAQCREAVDTERLLKNRLRNLGEPRPEAALVQGLLLLGGPQGPLPARPGRVPGTPTVPVLPPPGAVPPGAVRPPASRGPLGPGRQGQTARPGRQGRRTGPLRARPRTRFAAAMFGAACLVGAGVAGGVASSARDGAPVVVPPVEAYLAQHAATTEGLPFAADPTVWTFGHGR